jgi:hypothetical protein
LNSSSSKSQTGLRLVIANSIPDYLGDTQLQSQKDIGTVKNEIGDFYRIFSCVARKDNRFRLTNLLKALFKYEQSGLAKGKDEKKFILNMKRNFQRQFNKTDKNRKKQEGTPKYVSFHEFMTLAVIAARGRGRISKFATGSTILTICPTDVAQRAIMKHTSDMKDGLLDINVAAAILELDEKKKQIYPKQLNMAPAPLCNHIVTGRSRLCKNPSLPGEEICKFHLKFNNSLSAKQVDVASEQKVNEPVDHEIDGEGNAQSDDGEGNAQSDDWEGTAQSEDC